MSLHPLKAETTARGARMLRTAFGPGIAAWLEDPAVVEVMLNPDGRLWIDRLAEGLADTGQLLAFSDGERIIRLVAHHVGAEVHADRPCVSAELPETGEASRVCCHPSSPPRPSRSASPPSLSSRWRTMSPPGS